MKCLQCNEVKKLIKPRLDFLRESPVNITNQREFYLLNNINNVLSGRVDKERLIRERAY